MNQDTQGGANMSAPAPVPTLTFVCIFMWYISQWFWVTVVRTCALATLATSLIIAMRLMCTVERHNRELASRAMCGKRPITSVLTIGKKSSSEDISIVHHSVTNKENITYKVSAFLLSVLFGSFLSLIFGHHIHLSSPRY